MLQWHSERSSRTSPPPAPELTMVLMRQNQSAYFKYYTGDTNCNNSSSHLPKFPSSRRKMAPPLNVYSLLIVFFCIFYHNYDSLRNHWLWTVSPQGMGMSHEPLQTFPFIKLVHLVKSVVWQNRQDMPNSQGVSSWLSSPRPQSLVRIGLEG